jgi:hypothetical protein
VLPQALTFEQWAIVATSFVGVGLFIAANHHLRSDLRSVGI